MLASSILWCLPLPSQHVRTVSDLHADARMLATGGNKIPYLTNAESELSLHYILPYQLKELSCRRLQVTVPIQNTLLNTELEQAGDPVFQETFIYVGAGKQLSKSVFLKIQGGYYHLNTAAGTTGHSLFAELLCLYHPLSGLTIGCYLFNPTGATIKSAMGTGQLPQACNFGSSYQPMKDIVVLFEAEKQSEETLLWHDAHQMPDMKGVSSRVYT